MKKKTTSKHKHQDFAEKKGKTKALKVDLLIFYKSLVACWQLRFI